eukprot:gb/GEZJ01002578.1/.p1 GENE.gb/GEZJ01002578.1/~~gb/GEZJ01002578.1/.p1  ORF type:complete len:478 (-),score=60.41 gb/GEZJ01002578.1/:534-1967(-)
MTDEVPERCESGPWGPRATPENQQRPGSQDEFVYRLSQDRVARQIRMLELNQIPCLRDVREDVELLVTIIERVQKKFRSRGRFHLIMENEVHGNQDDDIEDNDHVETRVLFSPTISFQGSERLPIAEKLADCLNSFALMDKRPANAGVCALDYAQGNIVPIPPPNPQQPPFTIPSWYPGRELVRHDVGEEKWQELTQSKLFINRQLARYFSARDVRDVSQMYKRFFKALHVRIKALNKCRMPRTLVYAEFTPPWIRRLICVGEQISYLVRLTIPDLRNQRNRAGYQRMAFILAAFYEIEPMFSREILDGLLRSFPPSEPSRWRRERPMHPSQMATASTEPARKKRNISNEEGNGIHGERRKDTNHNPHGIKGGHPPEAQQSTDEEEKQTQLDLEEHITSNGEGNTRIPVVPPNPQRAVPSQKTSCGAGENCLFLPKEDLSCQDDGSITGRCSKCSCPLHDLCGGGEDGEMLCRRCKE